MITQAELKEHLKYEPDTGIFTWLQTNTGRNLNLIAGTKNPSGYHILCFRSKLYRAHRLAWFFMTGDWPKDQIDHINGVRNDNRFSNLREASKQQNMRNIAGYKSNTSGFKGVVWHPQSSKWVAQAGCNRKKIHLGVFPTPELASVAYEEFCKSNYREFYRQA